MESPAFRSSAWTTFGTPFVHWRNSVLSPYENVWATDEPSSAGSAGRLPPSTEIETCPPDGAAESLPRKEYATPPPAAPAVAATTPASAAVAGPGNRLLRARWIY